MAEKNSNLYEFTKGIIKQNPTLVTLLGMCPTLAVTTMAKNGIGMGLATTFVLVCSNFVISLLKNVIPKAVRLPCFIVIIAGFVTLIEFLMKGYIPELYSAPVPYHGKLYYPWQSGGFCQQEQDIPFHTRRTWNGSWIYTFTFHNGIYKRDTWHRLMVRLQDTFPVRQSYDSVHHAGRRFFRAWLSYCTCEQDSEQEAAKGDILLRLPKCGFVQGSVQNRE